MSRSLLASRLKELAAQRASDVFATFLVGNRREDLSFGELYERSLNYAAELKAHDVGAGDVVVVMLRQRPSALYTFLGAVLVGAIPTFMPFPSPKQRYDIFLADHTTLFRSLRPAAIVTYGDLVDLFAPIARAIDGEAVPHDRLAPELLAETAGTIVCLQHSSGTTALKKGVILSDEAIAVQIDAYSRAIGFGPDDIVASWLPLYHDMGFIACFLMPLIAGARVVMLDPFEWTMRPASLFDAIETERATFCWLPNFAFAHLVRTAPRSRNWDLSSIRAFISCSEPCRMATASNFLTRFADSGVDASRLAACYAMAENVFAITQTPVGHDIVRQAVADRCAWLPSGKPIDGVRVRIVNGEGKEAADGETGEISISSPCIFDGYYGQGRTRALEHGWYRTGDLGFRRRANVYVTGRVDDMLIINGRNVYAHEIEDAVGATQGVLPGRVFACIAEDGQGGPSGLAIFAESRDQYGGEAIRLRIRTTLFERLGLGVRSIALLPPGTLVKSTSGKLSRSNNLRLYRNGMLNEQIRDEYSDSAKG